MYKAFLTILIFLISLSFIGAQNELTPQEDFFKALNEYRLSHGCQELVYSPALEKQSMRWLKKIENTTLIHDRRFKKFNAEILAQCSNPFQCWKDSKPHNKILLTKKATQVGIAFYNGRACARFN
jgi:uncharacterized protein YkwD